MTLEELKNYYGTYNAMARDLCMAPTTYQSWKKRGGIPFNTQIIIEHKTKGRFKATEYKKT